MPPCRPDASSLRPRTVVVRAVVVALVATGLLWNTGAYANPPAALSRAEQAAAISLAARTQAQQGNFTHCAAMYHEAFGLDGKTPGYLFSAARCEQKAGAFAEAIEHFRRFAELADAGDPLIAKAAAYRKECADELARQQAAQREQRVREQQAREQQAREQQVREQQAREQQARERAALARVSAQKSEGKPTAPNAGSAGPAVALKASPNLARRERWGWVAAAAGAASIGIGAWQIGDGLTARSDLDAQLRAAAGASLDGKVRTMSQEAALARESRADLSIKVGAALAGVGAVSGGVALWLLLAPDGERVTLRPRRDLRGAQLTVRF